MGAAAPTLAAPTVVQLGGHVEKASGGGAMVRAIVKIAKGFHINAHEPDEPFLIPTVLELRSEEITFDEPNYPEPLSLTFPFSPDKPMLVYEGTIEIVAHASNVPTGPVYAKLRYQACDDETCLLPRTEKLSLTVPMDVIDIPKIGLHAGHGQREGAYDGTPHLRRLFLRTLRKRPLSIPRFIWKNFQLERAAARRRKEER